MTHPLDCLSLVGPKIWFVYKQARPTGEYKCVGTTFLDSILELKERERERSSQPDSRATNDGNDGIPSVQLSHNHLGTATSAWTV